MLIPTWQGQDLNDFSDILSGKGQFQTYVNHVNPACKNLNGNQKYVRE